MFAVLLALVIPGKSYASTTAVVGSPFLYNFNSEGILFESRTLDNSTSPYFWLSSGAKLIIEDGVGKTVQGPLDATDEWQSIYKKTSPLDSAGGTYPQDNFNLVTRSAWENLSQEISFSISKTNEIDSPSRDGYSGLFMLSRYKDDNNFYEAGIRMDGLAVIKKRVNGVYYTLGAIQAFGNLNSYNRSTNPNLIPNMQWMKLRSSTKDLSNGDVAITLYIDKTNSGEWTELLSVVDKSGMYGNTPVHKGRAYAGIHSDFMDVSFDDYKLTEVY